MNKIHLNSYAGTSFAAQKILRSGIEIYVTTMPISSIINMMPDINPKVKAENNRYVDEKHALSFGDYWLKNKDSWISPPISVTTTGSFDFTIINEIENTENKIGVLTLPISFKQIVEILDGQHRIYGFRKIYEEVIKKKKSIEEELINRKRNRENNPKDVNNNDLILHYEKQLSDYTLQYERFNSESVTVEIYSKISSTLQKKFFVTVAENAQGISKSVRTLLDDSKISTITREISNSDVVISKITNTDTSKSKRKNEIFKLEDISNIVKVLLFGYDQSKKITNIMDKNIDFKSAENVCRSFFDSLQMSIQEFTTIANTSTTQINAIEDIIKDSKRKTIAFSTPLLRALAHSYRKNVINLSNNIYSYDENDRAHFIRCIKAIDLKIYNNKLSDFWYLTGHVQPGKTMIESKEQDKRGLSIKFETLFNKEGISINANGKNIKIDNGKLKIL